MVINQRPALKRDDSHIECVYFFFPWTELCYEFMVSFPFRTSQKNRRKADLSNLILNVGKQEEEKSRDFKTFSLLPFIALGIFSWNVTSPPDFPGKLLLALQKPAPWRSLPPWYSVAISVFYLAWCLSSFAVINHLYVSIFQKWIRP